MTFRYIHDSWTTLEPGPIWDSASFPTVQTFFNGPGISLVARLTSTISPTLLNEFVASYTTDHISFKSEGDWRFLQASRWDICTTTALGANCRQSTSAPPSDRHMDGGFRLDPDGIWPEGPYNSNPTYTYRDNMTKIVGRHNLAVRRLCRGR